MAATSSILMGDGVTSCASRRVASRASGDASPIAGDASLQSVMTS